MGSDSICDTGEVGGDDFGGDEGPSGQELEQLECESQGGTWNAGIGQCNFGTGYEETGWEQNQCCYNALAQTVPCGSGCVGSCFNC